MVVWLYYSEYIHILPQCLTQKAKPDVSAASNLWVIALSRQLYLFSTEAENLISNNSPLVSC